MRVLRQIDLAHSALAKLRADFIATKSCAGCNRHRALAEVSDHDHVARLRARSISQMSEDVVVCKSTRFTATLFSSGESEGAL